MNEIRRDAWQAGIPRAVFHSPDDLHPALGKTFSDEQVAAITAPLAPGVIIAGAGSGKTTVMAARVVWLVGSGQVRPEQVLGLTFTRKAARELSQRIRAALVQAGVLASGVDEAGEQVVLTYDAFAGRLLKEHGLLLGIDGDATLLTGASRYRLASRVVGGAAGPFEHLHRLRPATITGRVLTLDAELASHLVARPDLDRHAARVLSELDVAPPGPRGARYEEVRKAEATVRERLELADLAGAYAQEKVAAGLLEFGDQMALAARLAMEVSEVGATLRSQFRVVLLDEYQDTSAAQAQLLAALFSGPDPDRGLGHAVTAVGDPFQAIYGWRGAAASNILTFGDRFRDAQGAPARAYGLTVNRRSGPRILDVANVLAEPLRADPLLAFDLSDALLRAPDGTPPGSIRVASFETWPEEVAWLADQVAEMRARGAAPAWSEIAVLLRRNADIGPIFAALRERDIPAEIVGLGGLLDVPEVADVVATLRVLDDPIANPDLVRLLTGPRWAIGTGDLALLGRRARDLASGSQGRPPRSEDLEEALARAVAGIDPTEVVSLADALEDLGDLPYSTEARQRFSDLARELASLRLHAHEGVLDLIRRCVTMLGLEAELVATGRGPEQLGAFLAAVGAYVDVDQDASLPGLLGYLEAERDHGVGLEQAVPSPSDSVKLLTVHRAKGLEWDVVFLPALAEKVFPSDRVTDNWVTNAGVVPADLRGDADAIPQVGPATNEAMKRYAQALSDMNRRAEDRLAYVAVTRARRLLVASVHTWRPDRSTPLSPSPYLSSLWQAAQDEGGVLTEAPPPVDRNPLESGAAAVDWPAASDEEARSRRLEAAAAVQRRRESLRRGSTAVVDLAPDEARTAAEWDHAIDRLLEEALRDGGDHEVSLPKAIGATALLRAVEDPVAFAQDLARPMPRPPAPAAARGSRFHAWVQERFGQQPLLRPEEVMVTPDEGWDDDAELTALMEAFSSGPFADLAPLTQEFPFSLVVDGQVVRGRIDAVYADVPLVPPGCRYLLVDWKTGAASPPDPLQLAIYRLAWSELRDVPLEQVAAAFYHVRSGELTVGDGLLDRSELEELVRSLGVPRVP